MLAKEKSTNCCGNMVLFHNYLKYDVPSQVLSDTPSDSMEGSTTTPTVVGVENLVERLVKQTNSLELKGEEAKKEVVATNVDGIVTRF